MVRVHRNVEGRVYKSLLGWSLLRGCHGLSPMVKRAITVITLTVGVQLSLKKLSNSFCSKRGTANHGLEM